MSRAFGFILRSTITLLFQRVVLLIYSLFFGLQIDPRGALALAVFLILIGITVPRCPNFGPPINQALSRFDPLLYAVNAARAMIDGNLSDPSIPLAFTVFIGVSMVTLALFIRAVREDHCLDRKIAFH